MNAARAMPMPYLPAGNLFQQIGAWIRYMGERSCTIVCHRTFAEKIHAAAAEIYNSDWGVTYEHAKDYNPKMGAAMECATYIIPDFTATLVVVSVDDVREPLVILPVS